MLYLVDRLDEVKVVRKKNFFVLFVDNQSFSLLRKNFLEK
ncbi:FIG00408374: hypothetical protein [Bacteroides ovatus]|nr:FIG00408374: hypothetical protein [Bacteroides ovatus]